MYITHLCEFALLGFHFTAVFQTRKLPVCAIQMHLQTDGKIKKITQMRNILEVSNAMVYRYYFRKSGHKLVSKEASSS